MTPQLPAAGNTSADHTVFAGRPLVVKIGGASLEQQRENPALWHALFEKHSTHAGGVVLVHGGGKMVDAMLDRLGLKSERREGIRITPADQMDVIAGVLAGTVNKHLVGTINAASRGQCAPAVGICLGDGGSLHTEKSQRFAFDPGCVGDVHPAAGDARLLRELLRLKFLPVVACVGISPSGALLNVNGDDAAAGVARSLHAAALVLLTDVEGVRGADGKSIAELSPVHIEHLISEGVIAGGMIPKTRSAAQTAQHIGAPVVILSAQPRSFEAYLRGEPVGTKVLPA